MAATKEEMKHWLEPSETARTMLSRVLERRQPSIAPLPPLHRVVLHGSHILEVAGTSGSGKSEVLLQAVVSCILPKEWQGLMLGGSEKPAVFIDLDCHFDMPRLVTLVHSRIREAQGVNQTLGQAAWSLALGVESLDDLLTSSLKRFYYKPCFSSFELLVALKTIRPILKDLEVQHTSGAQLLVIDSIGAFYWLDRAVRTVTCESARKTLSLHTVSEATVRELGHLLRTYPTLLILASKTIIHVDSTRDNLNQGRGQNEDSHSFGSSTANLSKKKHGASHREYMPAVWQEFVTHRLLLQGPFNSGGLESPCFTAKWDLPALNVLDRFFITNVGQIGRTSEMGHRNGRVDHGTQLQREQSNLLEKLKFHVK